MIDRKWEWKTYYVGFDTYQRTLIDLTGRWKLVFYPDGTYNLYVEGLVEGKEELIWAPDSTIDMTTEPMEFIFDSKTGEECES